MTEQWVRQLEQIPNTDLFMKRHYKLVSQLKELNWQPDDGLAGFKFALLESLEHLEFWGLTQLDYLIDILPQLPEFALQNIMLLLFDLGQLGRPAIQAHLEQQRNAFLYQQHINNSKVDVPLWYILLPLEQRPDLFNSSYTFDGLGSAKPVSPHASAMLVQAPNATRVSLEETKVISEKLQTHNQFAYLVLRIEPILLTQLIFTNHVESTRFSSQYTACILEAVYEHTYGLTGVQVVLLDAIDHPIDSRESYYRILIKRALQKALVSTKAES